MTNQEAELSTIKIVDRFFNFIRDNFDGFEHKPNPPQKWWHNHKFGEGSIIDDNNNYTILKSFLVKKKFGKKLTNASVENNNNQYIFHDENNNVLLSIEINGGIAQLKSNNITKKYSVYLQNNKKYIISPGGSWSPFIQACFIIWGEEFQGYKIGDSHTYNNLEYFLKSLNHSYENKYPDRCFDISWVNNSGELVLALETEEAADKKVNGSVAERQLSAIRDELEKLGYYKGKFKILISRPHSRDQDNGKYSNLISYFKTEIENKMRSLSIYPDEKWIIILIAPDNDKSPTEIRFHCYEWKRDNNNYSLKEIIFFNWNEIPKNNEQTLKQFLTEKFCVYWLKSAQIETDGKTIRAGGDEKSLLLKLNDEKTNVELTIDNNTENLTAKSENGDINIYKNYSFKVNIDSNGLVKKC